MSYSFGGLLIRVLAASVLGYQVAVDAGWLIPF
jgi:hypothetical protein